VLERGSHAADVCPLGPLLFVKVVAPAAAMTIRYSFLLAVKAVSFQRNEGGVMSMGG
jgi:hypothetical protein